MTVYYLNRRSADAACQSAAHGGSETGMQCNGVTKRLVFILKILQC